MVLPATKIKINKGPKEKGLKMEKDILDTSEKIEVEEKNIPQIIVKEFENKISIYADIGVVEKGLERTQLLSKIIKDVLISGIDYGSVPGVPKLFLWQSGADKLARDFGIKVEFEIFDKIFDIENKFVQYTSKAIGYYQNEKIGEAIASCNTKEKGKNNQDFYTLINTILQLSQKRAKVRLVRNLLGISDSFSQDEEIFEGEQKINNIVSKEIRLGMYKMAYDKFRESDSSLTKEQLKEKFIELLKKNDISTNFNSWTSNDISKITEIINDYDDIIEKTNKIISWDEAGDI